MRLSPLFAISLLISGSAFASEKFPLCEFHFLSHKLEPTEFSNALETVISTTESLSNTLKTPQELTQEEIKKINSIQLVLLNAQATLRNRFRSFLKDRFFQKEEQEKLAIQINYLDRLIEKLERQIVRTSKRSLSDRETLEALKLKILEHTKYLIGIEFRLDEIRYKEKREGITPSPIILDLTQRTKSRQEATLEKLKSEYDASGGDLEELEKFLQKNSDPGNTYFDPEEDEKETRNVPKDQSQEE